MNIQYPGSVSKTVWVKHYILTKLSNGIPFQVKMDELDYKNDFSNHTLEFLGLSLDMVSIHDGYVFLTFNPAQQKKIEIVDISHDIAGTKELLINRLKNHESFKLQMIEEHYNDHFCSFLIDPAVYPYVDINFGNEGIVTISNEESSLYPEWNSDQITYKQKDPDMAEIWEWLVYTRRNDEDLTSDQKKAFETIIDFTRTILNNRVGLNRRFKDYILNRNKGRE